MTPLYRERSKGLLPLGCARCMQPLVRDLGATWKGSALSIIECIITFLPPQRVPSGLSASGIVTRSIWSCLESGVWPILPRTIDFGGSSPGGLGRACSFQTQDACKGIRDLLIQSTCSAPAQLPRLMSWVISAQCLLQRKKKDHFHILIALNVCSFWGKNCLWNLSSTPTPQAYH